MSDEIVVSKQGFYTKVAAIAVAVVVGILIILVGNQVIYKQAHKPPACEPTRTVMLPSFDDPNGPEYPHTVDNPDC